MKKTLLLAFALSLSAGAQAYSCQDLNSALAQKDFHRVDLKLQEAMQVAMNQTLHGEGSLKPLDAMPLDDKLHRFGLHLHRLCLKQDQEWQTAAYTALQLTVRNL